MFPQYDPVCVLLQTPFTRWTKDDQKQFLTNEKPQPILIVNKSTKVKGKCYVRHFKELWYSRYAWLCGSHYLNKLFCLPCLVMSTKSSVWNKDGFSDFGNANRAFHKHECSAEHIRSSLGLSKLLINPTTIEDSLKDSARLYIKQFNEKVQLNRRFIGLPIRAVIYLGKQELAFRGHNEDESSANRGNFKELLNSYIEISSLEIKEHYQKIKPVFSGDSKTIQNELIDCLAKYEYKTKLVGQCYDGASVMAGQLNGLQSKVREHQGDPSGQSASLRAEVAPQAVFVHCLAHRLNLALQQSCIGISKCRIFFANVSGVPAFFHHSAKRTHVADAIIGKRIPQAVATRWSSNSKILNVIVFADISLAIYFLSRMYCLMCYKRSH
ncbi:hypothetical protein NQ315_014630 [Exocentrus adspersus]|uniref:DUF4371 domain-containing protein n=1 Tax=Exocentrus adspersus TaxID=1586481 RepID=A0AAV8VQE3_9CUCU|nr:hypothetical protein NQ315_014630 [Exocentrus adspersus]